MIRVGVVGGYCQLLASLQDSIRRAESRGQSAAGLHYFRRLIIAKKRKGISSVGGRRHV
jgi:hypothetical protein